MIINRPFWQNLIEKAWLERTIIWLMGVRRVGKTSLCESLPNVLYFDCELPRTRGEINRDPEGFLEKYPNTRIILDEVHLLEKPSEVLKIAADHYKTVKIIATGSSTLAATKKFHDTLTGRKRTIWLTPMLLEEMELFGKPNIKHRMLFGGFPQYFMEKKFPENDFAEWMTAYWAKDIEELYRVEKRAPFLKFTELLLAQSGGQFEKNKFAQLVGISRETVDNYLVILEDTFVVQVVRPYSSHRPTEIVKAPKVYGFDTGFVCHTKAWTSLHPEDVGLLWEQCILNELYGKLQLPMRTVHYWRDKRGYEIDFVLPQRGDRSQSVIECKFSTLSNSNILQQVGRNVEVFRSIYPSGQNYVVANDISHAYQREKNGIIYHFVNPQDLIKQLIESGAV